MAYIRVIYRTRKKNFDYVPGHLLDALIKNDEITHFYRPSERRWIDVKFDVIRTTEEGYKGPRRRSTDFVAERRSKN
jgi:hypothetical protein